jgi:uncharacterized low-complexity protein
MSNKNQLKPIAMALGTAFATSLAGSNVASADQNPFSMTELSSGYMVADNHEGKCGAMKGEAEGKCGAQKSAEEGKCGAMKGEAEGKCGAAKKAVKEGKCGEGKCGAGMKSE